MSVCAIAPSLGWPPVPDPVAAERVLRLSLLLPAAPSVLESSAPLGDIAASSFSGAVPAGPGEPALAVWRCASLALLE